MAASIPWPACYGELGLAVGTTEGLGEGLGEVSAALKTGFLVRFALGLGPALTDFLRAGFFRFGAMMCQFF
jgi:hypothetical protein